ncbi:MAG: C4-dicarboxylate ABC transporter, partial [Casimicrobiaceae bacterium]
MQRLRFLYPSWWAIVMGLSGLTLAWHRAQSLLGSGAEQVALALGLVTVTVFVLLALASLLRLVNHRAAWHEDAFHPVRHVFLAAIPISMLLVATVTVVLVGASPVVAALWWAGSLAQFGVTAWVLGRWWRSGLAWPGVTPALFIPVVGNVVAPLAGVPLGFVEWSAAQFGVGLVFWPIVLVLVVLRGALAGPLPDRLLPTAFITVAPQAVIGLAL